MLRALTDAAVVAIIVTGMIALATKFLWRRGKSLREP